MKAWIETGGAELAEGMIYTRKHAGAQKGWSRVEPTSGPGWVVEDPGFSPFRVVRMMGTAIRSAEVESVAQDWQPTKGLKGSIARWATRHGMTEGAAIMTGSVYEGIVIQTTQIAAGKDLQCASVSRSEIVHTSGPFVARDEATASGLVLAGAIAKGIKADDPTAPVEVKIRKYA
jgi:hypothetical protein